MGTLDAYQAFPSSKGKEDTTVRSSELMPTPTAPLAPRGLSTPAAKDSLTQPLVAPPAGLAVTTAAIATRQQNFRPAFDQPRDESCCTEDCWSEVCECLCQCACIMLAAALNGDSGGYHHHHHHRHGRHR